MNTILEYGRCCTRIRQRKPSGSMKHRRKELVNSEGEMKADRSVLRVRVSGGVDSCGQDVLTVVAQGRTHDTAAPSFSGPAYPTCNGSEIKEFMETKGFTGGWYCRTGWILGMVFLFDSVVFPELRAAYRGE